MVGESQEQMVPNSKKARTGTETQTQTETKTETETLEDIMFAHSAECGLISFDMLARCGTVSKGWQKAVNAALPTFVHLHFRGHEALVTGGVV